MKKKGRKISSLLALVLCIALATPTVFAYPIEEQVYPLNSTQVAREELTDVETTVYKASYADKQYAYSPAICVTKTGRIVVSYDINAETGGVKYSDDDGVTFLDASFSKTDDEKFLFGNVFETETGVYLIARKYHATDDTDGDLIIFKSTDNGANWGSPVTIDEGTWHTAPSEVMYLDGYVYLTWEAQDTPAAKLAGGAGRGILAPVVLKASVTADLTVPSNWTISDTSLSYYDAINGNTWDKVDYMGLPLNRDRFTDKEGKLALSTLGWLEGNIVRITDTNNELYDPDAVCHIFLRSSAGSADYANIMKVVDDGSGNLVSELVTTPSGKTLLYAQIPGGQSKFSINYDETSGLYWLLTNVSTDSMAIDTTMGAGASVSRHEGPHDIRNVLGLYYSKNAMDWDFAGIVSRTDSIDQARSYASMEISGDDLLIVSRSGDEEAVSGHNTNMILLHRIKNFRDLATDTPVTTVAKAALSNSNGTLFYDESVLQDESVGDIHTFLTAAGTTIITCAISDDKGTESKVLVKNADGYYEQTLTAGYKFGEAFEANGALYVFGVADKELVAFKSTDGGATWSDPATLDTTRNWYEAPTSTLINDNQIMLALSELKAGTFKPIRGYASGAMGLEIEETSVNLYGYGAVAYTEAFSVGVGESIEVTVSPQIMESATNNMFSVMFGDTMGSYFGNVADKGNGFVFRLKSNSDYTKSGNIWYNKVTSGELANADTRFSNSGDLTGNMIETSYTVKLTRTASTTHPWTMTVTRTNDTNEYAYQIPAADLAANAFDNGLYVSYGNNAPQTETMKYKVTKPVVTSATATNTEVGVWTKFLPANNTAWSGTISANGKEVSLTNRAAAYYSEAISVQDGTKISFDVTFPTFVSGNAIQYAFGLSSQKGSLYPSDTVAQATLGVQLVGNSASTMDALVEYETTGNNRLPIERPAIHAASQWSTIGTKTYSFTFTKQPHTDTTNSWVVTVSDGTTMKTVKVPVAKVAHNLFDATGVYITTGSLNSATHTMKISNLSIEKPAVNWSAIRGYSSAAGSLIINEDNATVFTGYGAVIHKDSYKLMPGESVSMTISPKTLKASTNNQFYVMFGDTKDRFMGSPTSDAGNNGIAFRLQSNGQYTGGGSAGYEMVVNGVATTTKGGLTDAANNNTAGFAGDMTANTYTITLSRTWNAAKPWKLTMTTSANTGTYVYEVPAANLAANAFDNGLYISAGNRAPQEADMVYYVSDVTYTAHTATATAKDAHKASPIVMTASITEDLTEVDSWTYMGGTSLVNKIGSVYSNTKMDYFGLPYENVDPKTIGWTDLKLFKLYPTDDIRYDEATGNVFGYMSFIKAGYNYAAFVKVNTSTKAIEFFTPASQKENVTEEEFVFTKLPGGNNGFDILFDSANKLYWLVTTVNTDTVNATNKSEAKIAVYYSANAYDWTYGGKVADVSGDARVSAAFSGDDIVITAVDGGVVNYVVPQYERLADQYNWTAQRGYEGAAGSITVEGSKLILDGHGAVTCGTNIVNEENTVISFTVKPTDLTNAGSYFSVGLLNKEGSFFGNAADTGSGFAISFMPWGSGEGAAIRYSKVSSGTATPAIGSGAPVGVSQISATMLNNEITVKFIKRTQIIGGVEYTWTVEVTEKNGGNVRTMNIPSTDVGMDLFDNGCYLIAGACNNIDVTYEIDDVEVKQYVTGDVNFDGEINVMDIAITDYKYRQAGGNIDLYAAYEKELYDINGDEQCNTKDVEALRIMVLGNSATSESKATANATAGNVRLERKYYQEGGKDMTDVTINTDFACGGLEGVFTYDSTKLTYKGVTCRVGTGVRNHKDFSIDDGTKGLMLVALGNAKYGTKGNIITLTFEGQIKDWNQFSMKSAVFTSADGKEQIATKFYDLLLGDVTGDKKDFEINAKDLVRMKKLIANERSSMNADLNRDNKAVPDDTDCSLLRDYLCGAITEF